MGKTFRFSKPVLNNSYFGNHPKSAGVLFQPKKTFVVDNKPVFVLDNKNVPKKKVLNQVYSKVNDDRKIPVVIESKEQYLKEYIRNQEAKKHIHFSPQQKQAYIKSEGDRMGPVVARYTTRKNRFIEPRVVVFTDAKLNDKQLKETLEHEYAHELWEKNQRIKHDWRSVNKNTSPTMYGRTDREEDFADSFAKAKEGELHDQKRMAIIDKYSHDFKIIPANKTFDDKRKELIRMHESGKITTGDYIKASSELSQLSRKEPAAQSMLPIDTPEKKERALVEDDNTFINPRKTMQASLSQFVIPKEQSALERETKEEKKEKIVYLPTEKAKEMREKWGNNWNVHRSDTTMNDLERSMSSKGFIEPIKVAKQHFEGGELTDGKHRIMTAMKLGLKEVPVDIEEDEDKESKDDIMRDDTPIKTERKSSAFPNISERDFNAFIEQLAEKKVVIDLHENSIPIGATSEDFINYVKSETSEDGNGGITLKTHKELMFEQLNMKRHAALIKAQEKMRKEAEAKKPKYDDYEHFLETAKKKEIKNEFENKIHEYEQSQDFEEDIMRNMPNDFSSAPKPKEVLKETINSKSKDWSHAKVHRMLGGRELLEDGIELFNSKSEESDREKYEPKSEPKIEKARAKEEKNDYIHTTGKVYPDIVTLPYNEKGARGRKIKPKMNEKITEQDKRIIINALDVHENIRPGTIDKLREKKAYFVYDDSDITDIGTGAYYYYDEKLKIPVLGIKAPGISGHEKTFAHEYAHLREDIARREKGLTPLKELKDTEAGGWVKSKVQDPDQIFTQHDATGYEARAEKYAERINKKMAKRGISSSGDYISDTYKRMQQEKLEEANAKRTDEEKAVHNIMSSELNIENVRKIIEEPQIEQPKEGEEKNDVNRLLKERINKQAEAAKVIGISDKKRMVHGYPMELRYLEDKNPDKTIRAFRNTLGRYPSLMSDVEQFTAQGGQIRIDNSESGKFESGRGAYLSHKKEVRLPTNWLTSKVTDRADYLRHELEHAKQHQAHNEADFDTVGQFADSYDLKNKKYGYVDNPYERGARKAGATIVAETDYPNAAQGKKNQYIGERAAEPFALPMDETISAIEQSNKDMTEYKTKEAMQMFEEPKTDEQSEEKIIIPLSSNTKTLAPHGSVNVEQYGFDFDKTIVHGTSAQNAKTIQDTMRFKQGTGLTPGRGGMEDASMWATNTFKNDAVVMLAETKEPNVRQHKGAWIHAGTRAEEWKGDEYSAKYPEGIELEKVKVFKPVPLVFVEKGKDVHETFQLEEIEQPKEGEEKDMAFSGRTGTPDFDEPNSRKFNQVVVNVSPDFFLRETMNQGRRSFEARKSNAGEPIPDYFTDLDVYKKEVITSQKHVDSLKPGIASDKPEMDELYLETEKGSVTDHEGRHRAVAAQQLGKETVPVHIIWKKGEEEPFVVTKAQLHSMNLEYGIEEPKERVTIIKRDIDSEDSSFTRVNYTDRAVEHYSPQLGAKIIIPHLSDIERAKDIHKTLPTADDVAYVLDDLKPTIVKGKTVYVMPLEQYNKVQKMQIINKLEQAKDLNNTMIQIYEEDGKKRRANYYRKKNKMIDENPAKFIQQEADIYADTTTLGKPGLISGNKNEIVVLPHTSHAGKETMMPAVRDTIVHEFGHLAETEAKERYKEKNKLDWVRLEQIFPTAGKEYEKERPNLDDVGFEKKYTWEEYDKTAPMAPTFYGTKNITEDIAETFAVQQKVKPAEPNTVVGKETFGPGTEPYEKRIEDFKKAGIETEIFPTAREEALQKEEIEAFGGNVEQLEKIEEPKKEEEKDMAVIKRTGIPNVDYPRDYKGIKATLITKMPPEKVFGILKELYTEKSKARGDKEAIKQFESQDIDTFARHGLGGIYEEDVKKKMEMLKRGEDVHTGAIFVGKNEKGQPTVIHEGLGGIEAARRLGEPMVPIVFAKERDFKSTGLMQGDWIYSDAELKGMKDEEDRTVIEQTGENTFSSKQLKPGKDWGTKYEGDYEDKPKFNEWKEIGQTDLIPDEFNPKPKEDTTSEDAILYHGTPKVNITKIKREGLKPHANYWGNPAVFLTPNREMAGKYGHVLEIYVPDEELEAMGHGNLTPKGFPYKQVRMERPIHPMHIDAGK